MGNNTTLGKIILIFLVILVLLVIAAFYRMLNAITYYFNNKGDYESIITSRIASEKSPENESIGDIVSNTTDVLSLCNSLIDIEIQERMKENIILQQKYEMRNLDTDAKIIAENVYKSINQNILVSKTFMLNNDYILKYITSQSLIKLISTTKEYNRQNNVISGN